MKSLGVRFSKVPVITGPVNLFCFPFQMGVSKVWKLYSKVISQGNKMDFTRGQNKPYFSWDFGFKLWFRARQLTGALGLCGQDLGKGDESFPYDTQRSHIFKY